VVGAGLAGLTAAWWLAEHGFRVTVLEARERIGGRVFTRIEERQHRVSRELRDQRCGAPGAGLPAGPVTALVADPHNSANCGTQGSCILYASVTSPSSPLATGVYKSINSGQTWSPVFTSATAVSGSTSTNRFRSDVQKALRRT